DQLFRRYRLGQEILGARLDGAHGGRCVGMSGDEDDRQDRTDLTEATLQFGAAQSLYLDVEQDASRLLYTRQIIEQFLRRCVGFDFVARNLQPAFDRRPERSIVVNHMNQARQFLPLASSGPPKSRALRPKSGHPEPRGRIYRLSGITGGTGDVISSPGNISRTCPLVQ